MLFKSNLNLTKFDSIFFFFVLNLSNLIWFILIQLILLVYNNCFYNSNYKLIVILTISSILFFHCSLSFFLPVWYLMCSCVCLPSYWSIFHSFLLILLLSPFFSQWSPVLWSLRASVDVYFSEPSLEGSFFPFHHFSYFSKLFAL